MRNKVGYSFLFLFFVGIFVLFQSFGILVILGFLICLPIISYILCVVAWRKMEFFMRTTGEILEKNQQFPVHVLVKNNSFIPVLACFLKIEVCNAWLTQSEKRELTFSVPAKGENEQVIYLASKYCGRITIQIKVAGIYDFLCLFMKKKKDVAEREVLVFPSVQENIKVDVNHYTNGNDDSEESHTKGSDFSEVSEIREYIPGDNLKDIHWKLSAKKEELMVKEHVSLSSNQIVVFVELYNDEFFYIDKVLEHAFSIAKNLLARRYVFMFCWWSENSESIKQKVLATGEDLEECFREIFYEKTYEVMGKGQLHFSYGENLPEHMLVVNSGFESEGEE